MPRFLPGSRMYLESMFYQITLVLVRGRSLSELSDFKKKVNAAFLSFLARARRRKHHHYHRHHEGDVRFQELPSIKRDLSACRTIVQT